MDKLESEMRVSECESVRVTYVFQDIPGSQLLSDIQTFLDAKSIPITGLRTTFWEGFSEGFCVGFSETFLKPSRMR